MTFVYLHVLKSLVFKIFASKSPYKIILHIFAKESKMEGQNIKSVIWNWIQYNLKFQNPTKIKLSTNASILPNHHDIFKYSLMKVYWKKFKNK